MNVSVSEDILKKFSNTTIGVIKGILKEDITTEKVNLINNFVKQTVDNFNKENKQISIEEIPQVKTWMNIFSQMNAKKGRESSIVFLTKYALENDCLFSINPIVDAYNAISLKYGIPMGAYDYSKLKGNVQLRLAKKGEEFVGINSKQIEKTSANEIVYADENGVFCRCWNDRDSDRTKIDNNTKELLIIFDGIDQEDKILEAGKELIDILGLEVIYFNVIKR